MIKVGLDLDGCVYKYIEDFDNFMISSGYFPDKSDYNRGLPKEELFRLLHDFSESRPYLWIDTYPKVVDKLKELSNSFSFYIVTHRNWTKYGVEDTLTRLSENQIPYKDIFFQENKSEIANKLNLDYFIEDNPEYALDIKNNSNSKVLLIDKLYNQNIGNFFRLNSICDLNRNIYK